MNNLQSSLLNSQNISTRHSHSTRAAGQSDSELQDQLKKSGDIPRHIAVIMDGNGRWATKRGLPRIAGHSEGVESVRDIVEACGQLGVRYLTLYAFSTENWKRPEEEVSMLMRLLMRALRDETDRLHRNNVRVNTLGDTAALPREVQAELHDAVEKTKNNSGLTLLLALSYSGRWDLTMAIRRIADGVRNQSISPEAIDEKLIASHLSTASVPDPDLLIRTSGEFRVSNFLLWQVAYSEIYISQSFWPEFRRKDLYAALADYQRRERRFGKVSAQVQAEKQSAITQR